VEEQLLQLTFPVQTILLSSGAGGGTGKGQASTLSTLSGRKTMSQTPNQPITDSMASWMTYMRKLVVADDPHPMASRINGFMQIVTLSYTKLALDCHQQSQTTAYEGPYVRLGVARPVSPRSSTGRSSDRFPQSTLASQSLSTAVGRPWVSVSSPATPVVAAARIGHHAGQRSCGGRLSRQDHYHVPDHRSW